MWRAHTDGVLSDERGASACTPQTRWPSNMLSERGTAPGVSAAQLPPYGLLRKGKSAEPERESVMA